MSTEKTSQAIEFIGRNKEFTRIRAIAESDESQILIVYGRRRVGKTELIERTLGSRNLIKLEGLEDGDEKAQIEHVLFQLSKQLNDPYLSKMHFPNWVEVFDFIANRLASGKWTLYLEEVQWLANYKNKLISALKYTWDNRFRHNRHLLVVLCGSSPSFMINQVVHSKALYNRSTNELQLREFSLQETKQFLINRSIRETMNAYLTLGGIPEYLKKLTRASSVLIGICENSFKKDSFFSEEFQRIFISSFASTTHYRAIIEYLSQIRFATRREIIAHLGVDAGGSLSKVFADLELCGFIERYTPVQASEKSLLARYCIGDNYLRFYYKFIKPIASNIKEGEFDENPVAALKMESYQKWLGFAFERFCRKNHSRVQ